MFEFVGRADRQVKIRGFRVEPGEIESCLNHLPGVRASAVVSRSDAGGHIQLIGYWVPIDATAPTSDELSAGLRKTLPEYMVPARLERLKELPLTPNGKIDRKRLQALGVEEAILEFGSNGSASTRANGSAGARFAGHNGNGVHQPSTAVPLPTAGHVLSALAAIAVEVLKSPIPRSDWTRPIGELGFDSIRLTTLSARASREFGVTVEESHFYEHKTLSAVADFLVRHGARLPPSPAAVPVSSDAESEPGLAALPVPGSVAGSTEPIAIVGLDLRVPGAETPAMFWANLREGRDSVGPMPEERRKLLQTKANWAGGYIDGVDLFDAPFFGISRRDAMATDPRQRLFLQAAWRAIENAGIAPSSLSGSRTGVYVGIVGSSEYAAGAAETHGEIDNGAQRILGAASSLIAARVSYHLNLRGPSAVVDTACSSSLVALHRAVMSLRAGECDQAIVGGVNLMLDPSVNAEAAKTGMLSATARCRAFDADADGYVRGEGVLALFLKPLSRALEAKDPIYAVLRGTAENHGGRAAGLTAPNPVAQAEVIETALARAGVSAGSISYVETHGTGTQLGDPIEVTGLRGVWKHTDHPVPCALGSVKTHVGHLEAAAGLAGVAKVLLALRTGTLPANLHFRRLNPKIHLGDTPFAILTEPQTWVRPVDAAGAAIPRRAGVSSFGFSGVNAHVVLEEALELPAVVRKGDRPVLVGLSAKSAAALTAMAGALADYLGSELAPSVAIEDVATTLLTGRDAWAERLAVVASSMPELRTALGDFAAGRSNRCCVHGTVVAGTPEIDLGACWSRNAHGEAAQAWVSGATFSGNALPWQGRCVHLPGYVFERRSYWLERARDVSGESAPTRSMTVSGGDAIVTEHRVAGRRVFPAVAYLQVVHEARRGPASAFTPCEWTDVTWLRPTVLGSDADNATLEALETDRTGGFEVRSIPDGDAHVQGRFTVTAPAPVTPKDQVADASDEDWTASRVYAFFAAQGMEYGAGYQTVVAARVGRYSAEAELATRTLHDGRTVHVGLLDGILQIAALLNLKAGGTAGLPFAAERIGWHAPFTPTLRVRAWLSDQHTIGCAAYDPAGRLVISLQGYAVRPSAALGAGTGPQRGTVNEAGDTEDQLRREADDLVQLERLGCAMLVNHLQRGGWLRSPGDRIGIDELRRAFGAIPRFHGVCQLVGDFLTEAGFVGRDGNGWRATEQIVGSEWREAIAAPAAAQERFIAGHPELQPHGKLVWSCIAALPGIVAGQIPATDIMFPGGSVELVSGLYEGSAVLDRMNRIAADAVIAAVRSARSSAGGSPLRLLEIGAGSGATSRWIAEALRRERLECEFVFTDISVAFRRHGERRFAREFPFMRFGVLNIDKDPAEQGYAAGQFDVVIGANVLHTIAELKSPLRNVRSLLRPGGSLVLVESVRPRVLNGLTYGLLNGWWAVRDPGRRLPFAPLCSEPQWLQVLAEEGFVGPRCVSSALNRTIDLGQAVIAAESPVAAPVASPLVPQLTVIPPRVVAAPVSERAPGDDDDTLLDWVAGEVIQVVRQSLQAEDDPIGKEATFESLGADSIIAVEIVEKLNRKLGVKLRTTDVFNYPDIRALAKRIVAIAGDEAMATLLAQARCAADPAIDTAAVSPSPEPVAVVHPAVGAEATASAPSDGVKPIAIVGMSGQFPDAANLDEFWANLMARRDSVREIPSGRWSWQEFFSTDRREPLKSYSRWGAFLGNHDGFDPLFFNVSPRDADLMGPMQRLFLMECYHALEDAGYSDRSLDGLRCGLFVGACTSDYEAILREGTEWGEGAGFLGNTSAILVGRIPYLLNLKGPALAIDTACSASLVALDSACESLRSGACTMALAGGVSVLSTQSFHIWASKLGMLSPTGRCHVFSADADGIAPGEAVGVVVLKLLEDALREGDQIHAVVRGSGTNHNGRTNGITAPSAPAQVELETGVYRRAKVNPDSIGYIECHGTGTKLGDPIEVAALTEAFRQFTQRTGFCALGSVKSNLGHCLAAAGVAGVLKTVLALKHAVIPPTLISGRPNESLGLQDSPFVLADERRTWTTGPGGRRRAAVSAFGFGGSNAHAVLEEAPPRAPDERPIASSHLFLVSAQTPAALRNRLVQLRDWLRNGDGRTASVSDVAFTLSVGRSHFSHRFACVADSLAELADRLDAQADQPAGPNPGAKLGAALSRTEERGWAARLKGATPGDFRRILEDVAEAYRAGRQSDWTFLFEGLAGRRISLPGYPFELRRCWIGRAALSLGVAEPRLAPLLDTLVPSLTEGCIFRKSFAATDRVLVDHQVQGRPMLPGVTVIEMAFEAAERLRPGGAVAIRDLNWVRPVDAASAASLELHLAPAPAGVRFALHSRPHGNPTPIEHSHGILVFDVVRAAPDMLPLQAIRDRCGRTLAPDRFYDLSAKGGVSCGPAFRVLKALSLGPGEALARLELAAPSIEPFSGATLPPPLLDGVLQTAAALMLTVHEAEPELRLPFSASSIEVFGRVPTVLWVHAEGSVERGVTLTLADESGSMVCRIGGYVTRRMKARSDQPPYLAPTWREVKATVEVGATLTSPPAPAVWLVTRRSTLLEEAIAARHAGAVEIRLARNTARDGDRQWRLDVGDKTAWSSILPQLPRPGVIYFSCDTVGAAEWPDAVERARAAKQEGVLALFRLVKALQAREWWTRGLKLRVITRGVWEADGRSEDPHFAAVTGFVASLGREYSYVDCACVDFGALDRTEAATAAERLASEPAQRRGQRVTWRDGRRFEVKLQPLEDAK